MMPQILRQVPKAPSAPEAPRTLAAERTTNGVEETDAEAPQLDDGRAGHPDADPGGLFRRRREPVRGTRFGAAGIGGKHAGRAERVRGSADGPGGLRRSRRR